MKKLFILIVGVFLTCLCINSQLTAAETMEIFELKNGKTIIGNVIDISEDTLSIRTQAGKIISLNRNELLAETIEVEDTVPSELQKLIRIAKNRNDWLWRRVDAIKKISEMGDNAAVPSLIGLATSGARQIREEVAIALGNLGDTRAIPILKALQEDVISWVRSEATFALASLAAIESQGAPAKIKKYNERLKLTLEERIETDPIKAINNTLLFKAERRDPAVACLLSLATIGGGQIYNYQPHKAIIAYIIGGGGIVVMFLGNPATAIIGAVCLLGVEIWSPFDAYNSAVDINRELEDKYKIGIEFRY